MVVSWHMIMICTKISILLDGDIVSPGDDHQGHAGDFFAEERQIFARPHTRGITASTPSSLRVKPRRTSSSRLPSTALKASVRPMIRNPGHGALLEGVGHTLHKFLQGDDVLQSL